MLYKTHLAFGLLAGLMTLHYVNPFNNLLFLLLVLVASLVPDIDSPKSKISSKIPILPNIITIFAKHRGIFHTLLFAIILSGLVYYFAGYIYGVAIFVGFLSHLISDAVTVQGIMPFHPLSKFRLRGFIETNSIFETIIFIAVLVIDVLKLIRL